MNRRVLFHFFTPLFTGCTPSSAVGVRHADETGPNVVETDRSANIGLRQAKQKKKGKKTAEKRDENVYLLRARPVNDINTTSSRHPGFFRRPGETYLLKRDFGRATTMHD